MFFSGGLHLLGLHVPHGVRLGPVPAHEEEDSKIHDGKDQVSLMTRVSIWNRVSYDRKLGNPPFLCLNVQTNTEPFFHSPSREITIFGLLLYIVS